MATPSPLLMDFHDQSRDTFSDIKIIIAGAEMAHDYVIWRETSFETVGAAQPGTCSISLRDPESSLVFTEGCIIQLKIDGTMYWQGYLYTKTMTYWFPYGDPERKWVLGGVDLNIILDKLVVYNKTKLNRFPDGGGAYPGGVMTCPKVDDKDPPPIKPRGTVPRGETDVVFLLNCFKDTDLALIKPTIKTTLMKPIDTPFPDGCGNTMSAGTNLRGLLENTASDVHKSEQGSVIFYIDPDGYLIWDDIDEFNAPFSVSDDASIDVGCYGLTLTRDISNIKDDVFVFAGSVSPELDSNQNYLNWAHEKNELSIGKYGRFQFSETASSNWSQLAVTALAKKYITQEGTPACRANFTVYKPGLFPGQKITIAATAHDVTVVLPIRRVSMSFPSPQIVAYAIDASADTQDPWGILLALKRPPQRGLVQPRFKTIMIDPANPDLAPDQIDLFTHVEEQPKGLGGGDFQCTYGYIGNSLNVYLDRVKATRVQSGETTYEGEFTQDFLETEPDKGTFHVEGNPALVWVSYHASTHLKT